MREPREADASAVAVRSNAPAARVIGLQRTIGNAAFGRLARSGQQGLSRACCASCGSGHPCEADEDAELLGRGRAALAGAVASRAAIQRRGDTARIPPGLPCPVASDGAPQEVDSILFPNATTVLHPHQRDQIQNFIDNWEVAGGTEEVRVDGFASTVGEDELNWRLSCERAQRVAAELRLGIPDNLITVFMQGETTEFGPSPENRRVTMTFADSPAPEPDPTPEPTPDPTPKPRARSCGPAIDRELTAVLSEIQRAFHASSSWRREAACDSLVTPPFAIMAWDILDLFLPHTSWLRHGSCGLPRIGREDPAGCANTVEVDGKCHLAGTVNYAMFGIVCRLCSDRHMRALPAFLDTLTNQWSLFDTQALVTAYNLLDSTGGGVGPPRDWATATWLRGPTGRPSGPSNRASCPVGCPDPPDHTSFDFAWPPIRGSLDH